MAQTAADSYKAEPKTKQFLATFTFSKNPKSFTFHVYILLCCGQAVNLMHSRMQVLYPIVLTLSPSPHLLLKGTQFGYILHGKMP